MNDQATTLRQVATAPKPLANLSAFGEKSQRPSSAGHTRSIAVTSGKGGVGKSNIAVNVALELAAAGFRVSLLDADLALANADVLLGLSPKYHLGHVLSAERSLTEVIIETPSGMRLIPGGSGIEELANLSQVQQRRFIAELSAMETESDFLIIDTAAGIGHNVTSVMHASTAVMIVTTPDPTAVVDAYATLKVLHRDSPAKPVWVVINDVVGVGDAERTFSQIETAAKRFLQHPLEHLGTIPRDPELAEAVRRQIPVLYHAPQSPASRSIRLIAKRLEEAYRLSTKPPVRSASFWQLLTREQPVSGSR
jgi:flagellar biosynthesis protein FlhG